MQHRLRQYAELRPKIVMLATRRQGCAISAVTAERNRRRSSSTTLSLVSPQLTGRPAPTTTLALWT